MPTRQERSGLSRRKIVGDEMFDHRKTMPGAFERNLSRFSEERRVRTVGNHQRPPRERSGRL